MRKIFELLKWPCWLYLFNQALQLLGYLEHVDFIVGKFTDPGWLRMTMQYLLYPAPIYVQIPAFVFGGYLLFYWLHIHNKARQVVQQVKRKEIPIEEHAETTVNETELQEERGFLDFMVDFDDANQNIIDCTTKMTSILNTLSKKIRTRTAEFKKI